MRTISSARRPAIAALLSLAGAASLALVSTAPAQAAETQSCWVNVDTGETSCFDSSIDTFDKIAEDTGLPVVAVQTGTAARSAAAKAATPLATAASYIITVGYEGLSYSGANIAYYTTNPAICSGASYSYATLGAWNDRFQSIDSYNGCTTTLYQDANFGGPAYGPVGSSTNIGNMRSQASSIKVG